MRAGFPVPGGRWRSAMVDVSAGLSDQPGERVQGGSRVWVGGGEDGVAGAVPVKGGQLLPGPFRCADDREAIDPAVGEGGCEGSW
jgi:hypothetical protein